MTQISLWIYDYELMTDQGDSNRMPIKDIYIRKDAAPPGRSCCAGGGQTFPTLVVEYEDGESTYYTEEGLEAEMKKHRRKMRLNALIVLVLGLAVMAAAIMLI